MSILVGPVGKGDEGGNHPGFKFAIAARHGLVELKFNRREDARIRRRSLLSLKDALPVSEAAIRAMGQLLGGAPA